MRVLQLRLPDRVHAWAKELATEEHISLNQFLATAASNEIVRQETRDFFRKAASAYSPEAFQAALDAIPGAPPVPGDELPAGLAVAEKAPRWKV